MAEWRFLGGWTGEGLDRRLRRLDELPSSAPGGFDAMPPEEGWREVRSTAVVGREEPGPPRPGGAYERAWKAVEGFAFSDPGIVTAHFDPEVPLAGRRMLLELRVLGLRYLAGTVVGAVRDETGGDATVRGYRYDTLRGHIEEGAEWFLLVKDHGSGEVRFDVHARWRPGDFPNRWSRAGFHLLGPRYQKRWHRRAHRRLAALAADPEATRKRPGRRPAHRTPDVGFSSTAGSPTAGTLAGAAALGALTGVRSTAGLAATAASRGVDGRAAGETAPERWMAEPAVEDALKIALAGEAVVDKLPGVPPRTDPLPLAGRALFGGVCGALLARRRGGHPLLAGLAGLVGAGAAVGAALGATALRRRITERGVPDLAVGLTEDAAVLAGARLLRPLLRSGPELPEEEAEA